MRIAILSIYPFPTGLAPTNRILAYSKGMIENGANIDIFIPFPTERPTINSIPLTSGTYQGIRYFYTSGRLRSRFKPLRVLAVMFQIRKLKGYVSSYRSIYQMHKLEKYNCLIISTDEILSLKLYSILSKKLKIPSIFIFDEFPIPIRHRLKLKIPAWKEHLYKKVLKSISAYVSISEELKNYFNSFCQKKTYVLNVIVDTSRFSISEDSLKDLSSNKYICYMGNMELSKDDVDNIIKAFALIASNYSSIKLRLYGPVDYHTGNILNKLITSLKLQERVLLMGVINSKLVPQILKKAYILVSSQPNTKRASGGFPTKLGEYLAAGVPALLTDVGENSKYVKDEIHIFFSKPQDPEAYAKKLSYIIDNYEDALNVAQNGKRFLFENYSHIKKGKELLEFISALYN
jgi:glycosyltransferase involved in cell wall biosynthesis